MGNYYEGEMVFILRHDTPTEIIDDLKTLATHRMLCHDYNEDAFVILKKTKWFKHKRFYYPNYYFKTYSRMHGNTGYIFKAVFCMKEYMIDRDDLGQDIYDTLKPYIDTTAYDTSNGENLGRIYDEDGTYDKTFYADEDIFKQEVERRKYICSQECGGYKENCLCDRYAGCRRAYVRGLNDGKKGIVHDGTKLIYKLLDFNKTN